MASTKRIINAQCDDTWSDLGRRFIENDIRYKNILSDNCLQFVQLKAKSLGTNIGYMLLPILTINYLLSKVGATIEIRDGFSMNLIIFSIFVGSPSKVLFYVIPLTVTSNYLFPLQLVFNNPKPNPQTSSLYGINKLKLCGFGYG